MSTFALCFAAAASNPQSLQQSLTPHGNQTVWKPRFAAAPEFDPQAPKQVHELQSRLLKRCAESNRMRKCRSEYLGMAMRLANTLGGEQSADWVEGEEFSLEEFDGLLAISTYNDAEPPPQSCGDCLSGNCHRVSFPRLETCSKCSHEHCAHPTCASKERQKYCSADAQAIARHESVSFGWTLDPRVAEEPGQFTGCPDGQRNPAESECLAAVQEAARGQLHVRGIRVVDEGPEGVVPGGCSYSHPSQRAMFNRNPAGRSSSLYTLVCVEERQQQQQQQPFESAGPVTSPPDKDHSVHLTVHEWPDQEERKRDLLSCTYGKLQCDLDVPVLGGAFAVASARAQELVARSRCKRVAYTAYFGTTANTAHMFLPPYGSEGCAFAFIHPGTAVSQDNDVRQWTPIEVDTGALPAGGFERGHPADCAAS